ncbi:MAG: Gfo/Idh/MocA family oxidoreductase [Bacteroidetes bacterium]|nr:Gfo/Idh/MocA family oxidoreductase [Bacteroidota bacterium]
MKNFVLIGVAGYVAPRHMKAIRDTGHRLLAALDIHDAAGVLDSYFPDADFFTEFERFDRHCEKLRRSGTTIDYVVVCSPNYLHDAHIRFGLRIGADVICEKPLVLNPWNVDALAELEKEFNKKVFSILQLRYHPSIIELRNQVMAGGPQEKYNIDLQYITARGRWYQYSWKGDVNRSGGIITNIGLHFFDMLIWIFGEATGSTLIHSTATSATGTLQFERATVKWMLSVDAADLPEEKKAVGENTYRQLLVNNIPVDFSSGFNDLHTICYQQIMSGNGIGLVESKKAISVVAGLRKS